MDRVRSAVQASLYEKLPCGRRGPHGLSRDQVAADQRRRLHEAMVQTVAEQGYAAIAVTDVVAMARVSKKTLYKHFGSKQECFLATYDLLVSECMGLIAAAYRRPSRSGEAWKVGLHEALEAFLAQAAAQPQRAWLMLVEALLVGPIAQERVELGELALAGMIERGLARAPEQIVLSPVLIRGMVHGICHLVRERLIQDRLDSLSGTSGELVEWMLSYQAAGAEQLDDRHMSGLSSGENWGRSTRDGDRGDTHDEMDHERARLLHAAAQIITEGGYEALTGTEIAELAGVQVERFQKLFGDSLEECLLAYLELGSARALARALNESRNASDWQSSVYYAIRSLLSYVIEDRAFARVAFVETFKIGRCGLARRAELMRRFPAVLLRRMPGSLRPSLLVAEAITGAVWGVIHDEVVHDRARRLQALAPQIAYLVLAPLTSGEAAAQSILALSSGASLDHKKGQRAAPNMGERLYP